MNKLSLRTLAAVGAFAVLVGMVISVDAPAPAVAATEEVIEEIPVDGENSGSTTEGEPSEEIPTEPDAEQEQELVEPLDDEALGEELGDEVASVDEATLPPIVSRAAPNGNYCTDPGVYALDTASNSMTRNVRSFPLDGASSTITGSFTTAANGNTLNGLAITPGGEAAFAVERNANRYLIHKLDAASNAASVVYTSAANLTNSGNPQVGAINSAGTIYYFGHFTRNGTTTRLELFAYNIATSTWIGQVRRLTLNGPNAPGADGDIAFDASGNMLILWGSGTSTASRLFSLSSPPTSAGTGNTTLASVSLVDSTNNLAWNGMAFDSSGGLWLQRQATATTSYRAQVNSATGELSNPSVVASAFVGNDLASCGPPPAHLAWSVLDASGAPVAGATVQVQGPRSGNATGVNNGTWAGPYSVADNGPLDEDDRDGYFKVSALGGAAIVQTARYGIRLGAAPSGYAWTTPSTAFVNIPAVNNYSAANRNTPLASAWPASSPGYGFGIQRVHTAPRLTWRVVDELTGDPKGGATVQVRGPRASSTSWTRTYNVIDCTTGADPCPGSMMDQDPRPGYFAVDTLLIGSSNGWLRHEVSRTSRYGIAQFIPPIGSAWKEPVANFIDIPGSDNSPSPSWPASQQSFEFGALIVKDSAYLHWEVKDADSNFVGGSTVRLQGPKTASGTSWANSAEYSVTDCTSDPCHPDSMDQDPAPGVFKVTTLRGLDNSSLHTSTDIVNTARYRVQAVGSIPNHAWNPANQTTAWKEVAGNGTTPAWGNEPGYNLGTFTLGTRVASDFCTAPIASYPNPYYTLNRPTGNTVNIVRLTTNTAQTNIENRQTSLLSSDYSLLKAGQSANALGVTPTGVFYFTGQVAPPVTNPSPAEIETARNATIYRFDPKVDAAPYPVMNMDLLSPTTGTIVAGDATIYNGNEEFYYAYYSDAPDSAPQIDGRAPIRFHLYRYSHGDGNRTGEVSHIDVPRPATFGTSKNGDFAFDAQNNLQFIISDQNQYVSSGVVAASLFQSIPGAHSLADVGTIQGTANTNGTIANGRINGVTYTKSGKAIVQQSTSGSVTNRNSLADLPALANVHGGQNFTGTFVDLASCDSPTTINVQKYLDGERYEESDQFTLAGERRSGVSVDPFTPVTTTGNEPGLQIDQLGPFVTTMAGSFHASETIDANAGSYDTTWECHALNADGSAKQSFASGTGRALNFALDGAGKPADVVPGSNLVCVFTNETLRSKLQTTKSADPASTTPVDAGQKIQYRLEFDNSTGSAPANVEHRDYLADVLDDATFEIGSLRYGDGTETEYPAADASPNGVNATEPLVESPWLEIQGVVPVGQTRTVWFEVTVKANGAERTEGDNGYVLNNYLRPKAEEPPTNCEVDDSNCTTHPVRAWTVSKSSQPPNGAWLHSGGNIYYMVDVTKVGAQNSEIAGIEVVDDMSEVMGFARMDTDAPNYGPQFVFDVKTYDAAGLQVRSFEAASGWESGDPFLPTDLMPKFTGTAGVTNPADPGWKWTTNVPAFTLNANEVRAQIVYVVKVGGSADPADPTQFMLNGTGDATLYPPEMLKPFKNLVGATSTTMPPNECVFGEVPEVQCIVTHTVAGNYFHIQKNSTEQKADGSGVIWNLPGVEFEIRDRAHLAGWPADSPSSQLCWSNYRPTQQGGIWTAGDAIGTYDATAVPDWREDSETYRAILAYNNDPANVDDQQALCALFYPLTDHSYGQKPGTWHARDLGTGEYTLVETKAPAGHQLLAETIPFTVGDAEGRHQLDLQRPSNLNQNLQRCTDPAQLPSNGTAACVMATGWLIQVYDTKLPRLPLTGGQWLGILTTGGFVLMIGAVVGAAWWRRRQAAQSSAE